MVANSWNGTDALEISNLSHRYGTRAALTAVSFSVSVGELFGLLGPNGGGKTTLFKIVSTLITPVDGSVRVFGRDVVAAPEQVRRQIGVVFQSPALDLQLRVDENLRHHGRLYGLHGRRLAERIRAVLALVRLDDRATELVGTLSGGLRRRAELAKALLPAPKLLILDEPSTGLDPGARRDMWEHLEQLRRQDHTAIVVTTHLMDEAARCDRVGVLHQGRLVAVGAPDALTAAIGADVILITTPDRDGLATKIRERFGEQVEVLGDRLRLERQRAHEFITDLVEAFPGEIDAVSFGKPTLEDVFMHHTGQRLD